MIGRRGLDPGERVEIMRPVVKEQEAMVVPHRPRLDHMCQNPPPPLKIDLDAGKFQVMRLCRIGKPEFRKGKRRDIGLRPILIGQGELELPPQECFGHHGKERTADIGLVVHSEVGKERICRGFDFGSVCSQCCQRQQHCGKPKSSAHFIYPSRMQ